MSLDISESTKRLAAQSTAYALRNWQDKQAFVKENENIKIKNEKKKSKSVKSLRYIDVISTNDFSLLESCQLYIIAKCKASNCCKIETIILRCFVKKVFLKVSSGKFKGKPQCQSLFFNKVAA